MITFIPTYSGLMYGDVNVFNIIPAILLISITMQTKLGEKVQILVDRIWELYEWQTSSNGQNKSGQGRGQGQGQVRVTQPLSQQYAAPPQQQQIMSMPPPQSQMTNIKSQSNEYSIPQTPNFNNMYAGPETPLVGAATPGGMMEGMDMKGGAQVIKAKVPMSEMFGYVTQLRTITSGRATSIMEFSHFAQAPDSISEEVIAKSKGKVNV